MNQLVKMTIKSPSEGMTDMNDKGSTRFLDFYKKSLEENKQLSDKQKRVLQASLELFSEKGFERTSTSDLAERAGVAQGTIFKRFQNKHELLMAVLAPLFGSALPAAVQEFITDTFSHPYDTLDEFVHNIVSNRLHFIEDNQRELRIILGEALYDPVMLAEVKTIFGKALRAQMQPSVAHLQATGEIADWPYDYIAEYLLMPILGYFGKILIGLESLNINEEIRYCTSFIIKGLRPDS